MDIKDTNHKIEGEISLYGNKINNLSILQKSLLISYFKQNYNIFDYTSIESRIAHGVCNIKGYNKLIDKNIYKLILNISNKTQILHLLQKKFLYLSTGEKQRIHLAKILINSSSIIYLFDEPLINLDSKQQLLIMQMLKKLANNNKIVICVMHELNFFYKWMDKIFIIKNKNIDELK